MEDSKQSVDKLFREQLTGFEKKPDEQIWERISERLARRKKKTLILPFLRIAAGMTLLLSLWLGYDLITQRNHPVEQAVSQPDKTLPYSGQHTKEKTGRPGITKSASNFGTGSPSASSNPVIAPVPVPDLTPKRLPSVIQAENPVERFSVRSLNPMAETIRPMQGLSGYLSMPLPGERNLKHAPPLSEQEIIRLLVGDQPEENALPESQKHHPWTIGGELAPLYSYRSISSDYVSHSTLEQMNKAEQGMIAYAGGIHLSYATNRRLSVQSGLYYARYGQQKNQVYSYSTTNQDALNSTVISYLSIENSTGRINNQATDKSGDTRIINSLAGSQVYYAYGNSATSTVSLTSANETGFTATQVFDYLEIPLTLSYKVVDRKFSLSLAGGLITNFMINNGVFLNENGSSHSIGKTEGVSKVNYMASIGVGLAYPVASHLSFCLQPRFNYSINSLDQSSQFTVHPYAFGLFAGLSLNIP